MLQLQILKKKNRKPTLKAKQRIAKDVHVRYHLLRRAEKSTSATPSSFKMKTAVWRKIEPHSTQSKA